MSYERDGDPIRGQRTDDRGQPPSPQRPIRPRSPRLCAGQAGQALLRASARQGGQKARLRIDERRKARGARRKKVTPSSHHLLSLVISSCFPFAGINQVRFKGLPLVATLSFRVVFKLPFSTPNSLRAETVLSDTSWDHFQSIAISPLRSRK